MQVLVFSFVQLYVPFEPFSDIIFKMFIDIHNQSASNRLCANFEVIPRSFQFWSFVPPLCVPLCVPFGAL